ncbi:MAG: flagellar basal body L-ring protein FlgH [Acidobacteriia bacterium]|nr:flagellar basal body L-ring protein FlgH [Terriglobia bacterium]
MRIRTALFLLALTALCAAAFGKDKKKQHSQELSPLQQYVSDASRQDASPAATQSPGSIWSPNALLANLGTDLKASHVTNLAKTNTQTALQGQGSTSRGATLTATVSARVTNVLPNGYLVVEGVKRVQVNSENQVITIRGVVRPFDLDLTNSVPSDRVAQMEVQVNGKGVVGDSIRRPFFLYRLILGLLPF